MMTTTADECRVWLDIAIRTGVLLQLFMIYKLMLRAISRVDLIRMRLGVKEDLPKVTGTTDP